MDHLDAAIPIVAFWVAIVAIIVLPLLLRSRENKSLHQVIAAAIEKDKEIPPELLARLKPRKKSDLRRGIVLIFVAGGIVLFAFALRTGMLTSKEDVEDAYMAFNAIAGLAAVPGMLGLAFLILGLLRIGKDED